MQTVEVTSVSSKGQIVIPKSFRKSLGIEEGSKLLVLSDGTNLLLKPMEEPRLDAFRSLISESRRLARAAGLKKSDVAATVKQVRNIRM